MVIVATQIRSLLSAQSEACASLVLSAMPCHILPVQVP